MSFSCMLAQGFYPERIESWPVAIETKFDGVRALFIIVPGTDNATCYSRVGKEFTSVKTLCAEIEESYRQSERDDGLVLDGELHCGEFNKTSGLIRRKNEEAEEAVFHCFDEIPYDEWASGDCSSMGFLDRREVLITTVDMIASARIVVSSYELAHSEEEVMVAFRQRLSEGHEGLIVKLTEAKWHPSRSFGWMKIKDIQSEDLRVIGCFEGAGRLEGTLGGIKVDFNGVEVHCGTGFSDVQRKEIWDMHHQGELVGLVAEVEYHEKTPYGSLRHPAFKGFRYDKEAS